MQQLPVVLEWFNCTYTIYSLLDEVKQGSGRISEIVRALKAYTYLDQAPVQKVDVHEGIDSTLVIMQNKLQDRVKISRSYADDLPMIEAYGSELNQVWTKLIDNAIDAMRGEGEIRITTRRNGNGVIVEIQDSGSGIPSEIMPKIYDPFFTTKPVGQGAGLGLNIVHNIVHKHNGRIEIQSDPGHTIFQIELPEQLESRE
jgi:signal transduction histidine kinase